MRGLIDVTVARRRADVLAHGEPIIYPGPLGELGIACEAVDAAARQPTGPAGQPRVLPRPGEKGAGVRHPWLTARAA